MRSLRRFLTHRHNLLALILIGCFIFMAAAAPLLAPPSDEQNPTVKLVGSSADLLPRPPSREARLGTLPGQVDVYHSIVWGARSALAFGLTVALTTALFGVIVGAASALAGGWLNQLIMRVTDAFLAFPVIAGVILFQQLTILLMEAAGMYVYFDGSIELVGEPSRLLVFLQSINPVMLAFILFSWMPYARLINTVVLRNKQADYVLAAQALGAGSGRLVFRHLIPNSITPALILAARDIGGIVLLQATFTFIGLGGRSVWGDLLVRGRDWIIGAGGDVLANWWVFLPATLALILFGVSWNLLGDGLNDWLNPRAS